MSYWHETRKLKRKFHKLLSYAKKPQQIMTYALPNSAYFCQSVPQISKKTKQNKTKKKPLIANVTIAY